MKRTILKKYLVVSTLIILISFFFLGIMLWFFVSAYWKQEKNDLLTQNAKSISDLIQSKTIEQNGNLYIIDSQVMQTFITAFAYNINAEIFVTDENGQKIFCSEGEACRHLDKDVPERVMYETFKGSYAETTTLENIYQEDHYVVGIPITSSEEYDGQNIGAVFTAIDAKKLYSFRSDIFQIFLIAGLVAFIISSFAMGVMSYRMTLPLIQMSDAAKSFGKGDFSKRIDVKSKDEVGQLADSLNNMADSLSALENMRRSFVANVSHELKTPMTTISGFVDGILDHTVPEDKQMYYLNIVSSEVKRLSRLVKSMLDLSRIDSGNFHLNVKSFDLSQVIINTLVSFEGKISSKNVQVRGMEYISPVFVDGDIDMIHQVVYNLIDNAVKFVEKSGHIKVYVSIEQSFAVTRIINSGKGIPKDEIDFVFDRFYKTDKSRSQDKNGMGLGLYIAKTIIRLHGGEIKASSAEDGETEFSFSIPVSK